MKHRTWQLLLLLTLAFCPGFAATPAAKELKLEAQLVWGTNEDKSPDPEQKPVTAEVEKRLKCLPFKWQHYYEVTRKAFKLAPTSTQRVKLSKDCLIIVKLLENDQVEVTLMGKEEVLGRIKLELLEGETLVLGGNAQNYPAWFVLVRQVK